MYVHKFSTSEQKKSRIEKPIQHDVLLTISYNKSNCHKSNHIHKLHQKFNY